MNFENQVITGIILNRYKRFLSDIELPSGEIVNAHVPNTGSMKNCWEKGQKVLLTKSDNPKRKLSYTLECTHNGKTWIGVNTTRTNKIVKFALDHGHISEFKHFKKVSPEVKYNKSRLDFLLSENPGSRDTYLEVKNVTLNDGDKAIFPDSVSVRGQKHLRDLMEIVDLGYDAAMLYIVNRDDVNSFSPAREIDKDYARLLSEASQKGVRILAYKTKITMKNILLGEKVRVDV